MVGLEKRTELWRKTVAQFSGHVLYGTLFPSFFENTGGKRAKKKGKGGFLEERHTCPE